MDIVVVRCNHKGAYVLPSKDTTSKNKPVAGMKVLSPGDNELSREYWEKIQSLPGVQNELKAGVLEVRGYLNESYGRNIHDKEEARALGITQPYTSLTVATKHNQPPTPQLTPKEFVPTGPTPEQIATCSDINQIVSWGQVETRPEVIELLKGRYNELNDGGNAS